MSCHTYASTFPDSPIALGGPGKTDAELFADVTRLHIESPSEILRLFAADRSADVLLRVNLDIPISGASLAMGGGATPFGMDPEGIAECIEMLSDQDAIRLRGIHAHLAVLTTEVEYADTALMFL
ncbi:type III PLP-dependent enzyme domain-containing protein [Sphaerisporangium corydalis]|uniref:Orn/DAP/Arg decarboxylase 2 N-terminal domain-containing protein n=1 Tax=Sphaerisporangium corydalis TaxID=1441875 RepID=A0ABV9EPR4_9ACTN|nr:hypothetical protein [Sphaerisporangium corydalis]